ncbi:MAG: exodeoxyribonuclease VII small subunit [Euryarchaeota archaeon]|nr:exodeoxyribonuclease VII small subunit [Euryarchaeota archaeon]
MNDEQPTYSEAIQRLEEIVALLERGGMGLDETLKFYEEGAKLLSVCKAELASAEGRLNELQLDDIEASLSDDDASPSA